MRSSKPEASAASIIASGRTRFGIASPRTCWSEAWTFASSRFCWDMQVIRSTEIYTHLSEPLREDLRRLLQQTTEGLFEGRRPQPWLIRTFAWRIRTRNMPHRTSNWPTWCVASARSIGRNMAMMLPSHKRALADIEACCTKQLGGRLYQCDDCSESFWVYHCCRNRACPKCHAKQTEQWLAKRQAELLPCDYFHAVATVPSELRGVFRRHQKLMYGLLMRVSAEAVQELCAVRRHLGALPGILSIFHSWNGQLQYHPHVHMLITGGGISSDGQHWEPARGKFLVPVQVLSRKIAAKFRDALRKENPELFATIPATAWRREWVSFCKHYGRGNDAVLNYLSRYVFRTAISNARILGMDDTT